MTQEFEFPPLVEFRAWVNSKDSGSVIGYSLLPCDCPVAYFLSSLPGVSRAKYYGVYGVEYNGRGYMGYGPIWAMQFMVGLDLRYNIPSTAITKEMVLDILQYVEE